SLSAGNDCPGMSHALAGRSGLAGDESRDRLGEFFCDVFRRFLLSGAADFSDHDHPIGLGIRIKELETVDEVRATYRIPANSPRRRLAQSQLGELVDGLVRQCSRP